jgi:hypothetical protein
MDDQEELATARAQAQKALSNARLAADPDLKKQWAELAQGWLLMIERLEARDAAAPRGERKSRGR